MKKTLLIPSLVLLAVAILLAAFALNSYIFSPPKPNGNDPLPFLVGVTYCGNTTEGAKQLIDKVKDYTNFFVLQSGLLQEYPNKINEICDYASSAGLYFMVYFGNGRLGFYTNWVSKYDGRWGDKYLGVYYGDEPGGKMLDSNVSFTTENGGELKKYQNGSIAGQLQNGTAILYQPNGVMVTTKSEFNSTESMSANDTIVTKLRTFTTYCPNGTVKVEQQEYEGPIKLAEGNPDAAYTYEQLWNSRPFQTYDETAETFTEYYGNDLGRIRGGRVSPRAVVTSDYALYCFDYLSGYDMVLAQVGWNNTESQEIALVRGAANMQSKEWGVVLTWKYTVPPYLTTGEEMFGQMRMAYENGASCVVIFNYAEQPTTQFGTLDDGHFAALERFWNEVVQNPKVVRGGTKAEAALVLPTNYGWGMRNPNDTIWGLWQPDEKSEQIWLILQQKLAVFDSRIDIIFEGTSHSLVEKYSQVYYWNQTG